MLALALVTILIASSVSSGASQQDRPGAQTEQKEGPTLQVEAVVFVGNRVFSDGELRDQLQYSGEVGFPESIIRRRNVYTRERLQADALRLRQYMADRGYAQATVGEPVVEYINLGDQSRTKGDVPIRLVLPINEGPLHRLNSLIVQGGRVITNEQARAQFDIKAGDLLRASLIEEGLSRLRRIYGRQGYLQFAPTLDFKFTPVGSNEALADISINLNEGSEYTLGRLEFAGNVRTLGTVLRQMIPLDEGEVFDYARLEHGIDRINRSGLFEPVSPDKVVVSYEPQRQVANVEVRLTERDNQRFDVNGGGGTTGGASVGFDYSNINLTGRADSFGLQLRIGNRERVATGRYATSLLTVPPIGLSFTGYYQRYEFVDARTREDDRRPLYIQNSAGASFGLSFPLTRSRFAFGAPTRAGIGYSFTRTKLEDLLSQGTEVVSRLEQSNIRMAGLTPFLTHNTLEREFDPRVGRRLAVSVETNSRAFGGNVNTVRPFIDYRQFLPFGLIRGEPRVFGFRVRASHIAAFGEPFPATTLSQVNDVPIFSRFFLGGETEVRGYDVNSIAPLARVDRLLVVGDSPPLLLASDIRPVGGDTLLVANVEYRVPLTRWLSTAAFFDSGASLNARRIDEQRFESPTLLQPGNVPATLVTVLRPLEAEIGRLPNYRASLGLELRFTLPAFNLPLRLIFSYNPNAQRNPPDPVLLAPERRFTFRIGFGRTL